MKLLIIEDDSAILKSLSDFLKNNNYAVDTASDGESGFNLASSLSYDLIITDYLLPKLNGQEIIKALRKNGNQVPILVLSVKDRSQDKINLLNNGADDYLAKPFFFNELQSRIKALLRRQPSPKNNILEFADLKLNLLSHEAIRDGRHIYLTTKEFCLLQLLMKNPKITFSRQIITEEVWYGTSNHLSNIIEALILKLRKKIDFKKPFLIKTIPGHGYRLDSDIFSSFDTN